MIRRGSLLLELMIAIAIFTAAGLSILALMRDGVRDARFRREQLRGMDLARSAIAQLECGLATAETLDGPVAAWHDSATTGFEDRPPVESAWNLDIQSAPAGVGGLTLITVTASRESAPRVRVTLRQITHTAGNTEASP